MRAQEKRMIQTDDCSVPLMNSLRKRLLDYLAKRRPQRALAVAAKSLGVSGITLRLPVDSPLYGGDGAFSVDLPVDEVVTPFVMAHHRWQPEELDFFQRNLPDGPCVLVDIGANIGLVTRQLMHRLPSIRAAVCFEPNPANHELLCRNLRHLPQCAIVQAALASEDGVMEFFEDSANYGNYSLNRDAMKGRSYKVSKVRCLKATIGNLLGAMPAEYSGYPILWKSDTQGFDEVIATTLPDQFWNRVHAGIMEIWRIDKPAVDHARLASILDTFPFRAYADAPDANVSTDKIVSYCQGRDHSHKDLLFSRAPIRAGSRLSPG
ncbi:MAG: FkbM family methyltransferase [Burkholderiales bacterium]